MAYLWSQGDLLQLRVLDLLRIVPEEPEVMDGISVRRENVDSLLVGEDCCRRDRAK